MNTLNSKSIRALLILLLFPPVCFSSETPGASASRCQDLPKITALLKTLKAESGLSLGKPRVKPDDASKYHSAFKSGPGVRNFCNKMVYAPDRLTALYCGANHNSPHRLNDAWEYHLGSNTWDLICPPANDYVRMNKYAQNAKRARDNIAKKKDVEKNRAYLDEEYPRLVKKWYGSCTVKDGYFQGKKTGGPINPRHTWDGLAYDHHTGRLYWALLDVHHTAYAKRYALATGLDPEEVASQIKPASTMWIFDPKTAHWTRQMGQPPFPRMHGMGGSLLYLPDRRRTIWYIAAQNRSPNDFGMWSYDAKTNVWEELIGHSALRSMVQKKRIAPGSELQARYSARHGKIVAVLEKGTFIFDVEKNTWSRGPDCPGFGHDAHSVFAYDTKADTFLLVSKRALANVRF